ncbi:hypothetical protein GW17_00010441 [Ensete ventricosum]|nr:hypothetical protein GW17_00010441 [Ensete ventricosum]RZS01790.1 hypothetical protein BHM03_00031710 [Ensete ventricosum]
MRGARLVLPARSLKAAEETRARITGEFPGTEIIVLPLDLSSLSSVRCFVFRFRALNLPLNLLINNAGKFSYEHAVSEDGVEMTFATNYLDLAFFLASKLLKTIPQVSAPAQLSHVVVRENRAKEFFGASQAAATTCYVATHPRLEGVSGKYFADCNEVSPSSSASSPNQAARLWRASEAMTTPRPDRTWFGLEPRLSSDKPDDEM